MPYFTAAERRVRDEVRLCELSAIEATSTAVSCSRFVLAVVEDGRRFDGQDRVEWVRRLI